MVGNDYFIQPTQVLMEKIIPASDKQHRHVGRTIN